ncbi:MAG: zinc ABC transporter substrate-binding protein, partial [Thermoleophilaceae bacterium]|nr:zinc ABC transporter substrate-binding protein [Thermoleophilaceae bacterium]
LAILACTLAAGTIGAVVVLRDLPFFSHAVGAGSYPVLVLALGIGVPLAVAAPIGSLLFALVLWLLTRNPHRRGDSRDAETGIVIAASFALGSVLVATISGNDFAVAISPESLLFGSVLTASPSAIMLAFAAVAASAAGMWLFASRWVATGFDPVAASRLAVARFDVLLLVVIALVVAATLPVAGSLMGAALLVIPAATARLFCERLSRLIQLSIAIAVFEGVTGLYFALIFDLPPGAVVATLAGSVFAVSALWRVARDRRPQPSLRPQHVALLGLSLSALALVGCGSSASKQPTTPVAVATTTQVGDIIRQVGGNDVLVTTMLKPGVDPHSYEPTASDVRALTDARVIFASGGELDRWLAAAMKSVDGARTPVDLSDSVTLISSTAGSAQSDGSGSGTGGLGDMAFNPHWYLDPNNVAQAAARVRDELTKANAATRQTYRANADDYVAQASALVPQLRACGNSIARGKRRVVADHNDFQYLTNSMGIAVVGQLRSGGESEASAKQVDQTIARARAAGVGAVITSKGESDKLAKTVAARLGVPLLQLYGDSLAASGPAASLLGAISDNAVQITKALGGDGGKCAPSTVTE